LTTNSKSNGILKKQEYIRIQHKKLR